MLLLSAERTRLFFFLKGRHHLKGDVVKPEMIFWTIAGNCICRHLCRKENHSQYHFDFFDVVRRTNTILDVLLESRIDDSWNVDGQLLWTSFTQFTKNISRRIHVVRRVADKNSSNIKVRLFVARDLVRNGERKISSGLLRNRSSTYSFH